MYTRRSSIKSCLCAGIIFLCTACSLTIRDRKDRQIVDIELKPYTSEKAPEAAETPPPAPAG